MRPNPAIILTACLAACAALAGATTVPAQLKARIIAEHPHDRSAYTQGLLIADGALFESTGLERQSSVRLADLATGRVLKGHALKPGEFGEGLAYDGRRLVQLTWTTQIAYIYDPATLKPTGSYSYEGQGWGLTHDGTRFIMSDGSPVLQFRDTETFDILSTLTVTSYGKPVEAINELEWADGRIYANVHMNDIIVRFDPADGAVDAIIDCRALRKRIEPLGGGEVLNGIAHDRASGKFYVTGKLWPLLFEVEFR